MNYKGEIDFSELAKTGIDNFKIIDVRSESEYLEDHIPNSVNIPLLTDQTRKTVGIIYKNESPVKAKLKAVELISPNLPNIINQIYDYQPEGKYLIFYCWRGGLRSEFILKIMRMIGVNCSKIRKGYKSYRHYVIDFFEQYDTSEQRFITIYGYTGSGKTEILENLKKTGLQILNLEKAASHKGSNFGDIDEPDFSHITQKKFESKLWYDLAYASSNLILTEGESKKIGKVTIPKKLFTKITNEKTVLVDLPLEFRIEYTIKTYRPEKFLPEIKTSLNKIKKYIGSVKTNLLFEYLEKGDFKSFTKILLEEYYDPIYKKSFPKNPDYYIKCYNIDEAEKELREIYDKENII
jgi:tRNA 2-selenouridine synthase